MMISLNFLIFYNSGLIGQRARSSELLKLVKLCILLKGIATLAAHGKKPFIHCMGTLFKTLSYTTRCIVFHIFNVLVVCNLLYASELQSLLPTESIEMMQTFLCKRSLCQTNSNVGNEISFSSHQQIYKMYCKYGLQLCRLNGWGSQDKPLKC